MRAELVAVEADRSGTSFESLARGSGLVVRSAGSVENALTLVEQAPCDAVLLDLDVVGEAELADTVRRFGEVPVVAGGAGGARQAVLAMRAGARDFVEKPFDLAAIEYVVAKVLAVEAAEGAAPDAPDAENAGLLGDSKAMRQVYDVVRRVAVSNATALVRGESGTGKELVARALHREGLRSAGPFVKVHCAGLPETLLESELFGYERGAFTGATCRKPGRVEVAEGGTLFLDEVGDITPAMQVKLLRLLQDREYERLGSTTPLRADVRFIAATHRDLEHLVKKSEFREDLFYRLNVVPIWLPPLRARKGDVEALAKHFCAGFVRLHGKAGLTFSEGALAVLSAERWPGNVRQLQNFVERLVVLTEGRTIDVADVKRELSPQVSFSTGGPDVAAGQSLSVITATGPIVPLDATLRAAERAAIERALRHVKGNRALAARLLGVGRATLYKKIVELGIE